MIYMMAALMSLACTDSFAQPHKPKKAKKVKKVEVVAPSHRTFGSRTISVIPSKVYTSASTDCSSSTTKVADTTANSRRQDMR